MDPFTIAFIAKTGFDLLQGIDGAGAKKKQADFTRQLSQLNKQISDRNAFEYLTKGLSKANAYKAEADQQMSKQNVAYAYADVDTSFGTAQMIQEQSRLNSQFNTKQIEEAAYAAALGEKQKGLQYSFQGELTASSMEQQASQMLTSAIVKGAVDTGINWKKLNFDPEKSAGSGSTTYDALLRDLNPNLTYFGDGREQTQGVAGLTLDTPKLVF